MYEQKFQLICEAFEVLSNPQLKTIYEQFGEECLRTGIRGPDGVFRGGYCYQDNCYDIFNHFFLKMNPFYDICDNTGSELDGSVFGTAFGALNEPPAANLSDIHVSLEVTLKEFFCGSKKEVNYTRQVVGLDGRSCKQETASVELFIRPGMDEKQELVVKGKGNEAPRQEPTDLIVKFKSVGDAHYTRQGSADLIYHHRTSLQDVINCKPVQLTTLDGRRLLIPIDQVMSPNTVKLVENEGFIFDTGMKYEATERERMLMQKKEGRRGNLYILFAIDFPRQLSRA